jgi:hypothetical protein
MSRKGRLAIVGLAIGVLSLVGCTTDTTEGEAAVRFEGRTWQLKKFDKCMLPLQRISGDDGNDETWRYPAGQRAFEFGNQGNVDAPPIQVVTKDNVVLSMSGSATFALNISCDALRAFHDNIGRPYNPDPGVRLEDTPAWDELKRRYIGGPLEVSMDRFAKDYTWKELFQDPDKKTAFLASVGKDVPNRVKVATGSQIPYFCSPSYRGVGECGSFIVAIPTVTPPGPVLNAMAQDAANKEINTAIASQDRVRGKLIRELGAGGFLRYQVLEMIRECNQRPEDRKCQMAPPVQFIPEGSGTIVDGRAQ